MERLCADGLISADQLERILVHYRLEGNRSMQWLTLCLSCLAAVLVIGGVVMLVSANWHSIPPAVKMGGGIGLMFGIWVMYACFRNRHPVLAEGLGLAGGGLWLANIALYSQIFQLQNPFVEGLFLFLVGIVLIPVLVQQRIMVGVVAAGSCILLLSAGNTTPRASWLGLNGVLDGNSVVCLLMLLFLLWWLVAERWRGCRGWWRSYAWVGVPSMVAFLSCAQFWLQYEPGQMKAESPYVLVSCAAIPLLMWLLRPRTPWKPWLALTVATSCLLPLAIGLPRGMELAGIAAFFIYSVILMICGARCNRRAWVNEGCLGVVFAWFALMCDILQSYTDSGLALLAGGVLLFVLVAMLGRQRRRLLSQMKQASPVSPTSSAV